VSELYHYASKYYDPKKAHEYYEAHKQLKGRNSTAGLTEEGREAAQYVKKTLTEERKKMVAAEKEKTNSEIKAHSARVQFELAKLRIELDSGSVKNNPEKKNELKSKIQELVNDTINKRKELLDKFKAYSEEMIETYDKKYEDELESIRGEFTKQKQQKTAVKKASSAKTSVEEEKPVARTSEPREPSTFTPVKKEQTSKWARNRAKRKELEKKRAALKHSETFIDDQINNIVNSQQSVDGVIERNKQSDSRIAYLDEFIHSLPETY